MMFKNPVIRPLKSTLLSCRLRHQGLEVVEHVSSTSKTTQFAGFFETSFYGNSFSIQEVISFFKDDTADLLL